MLAGIAYEAVGWRRVRRAASARIWKVAHIDNRGAPFCSTALFALASLLRSVMIFRLFAPRTGAFCANIAPRHLGQNVHCAHKSEMVRASL
jgi:hypothetical protein